MFQCYSLNLSHLSTAFKEENIHIGIRVVKNIALGVLD